jgi:hypothetical protein
MGNRVFCVLVCVQVCASGCGSASGPTSDGPGPAEVGERVGGAPVVAPSSPAVPEPPAAPAEAALPGGGGAAAATIGLDLRALPTNAGAQGTDMFVLGQGDRIRRLAPAGVEVEIRHVPGSGVLIPVFRAATAAEAEAVCAQVVAAYLEHAPRLPVIMEPAAQLVEACHAL